jgi:glutaconate CoA-transferase subunit B
MPGAGPLKVITDKGILEPDESGELVLTTLYPDVTADDVRSSVGWPLRVHDSLDTAAPPTASDLDLLRRVLDPRRLFLGTAGT